MKIDFTVPCRRMQTARTLLAEPAPEPQGRAPRIARLVALAHKLDAMVRSGEIRDYAQLAQLGHVSPARITQIMALLHLAPAIQEYVLFLSAADHHRAGLAQDRSRAVGTRRLLGIDPNR